MLKKTKKGYWVLESFDRQKELIHGFSSKQDGNLWVRKNFQKNKKLDRFLKLFDKTKENLVLMEQIRSHKIKVVNHTNKSQVVRQVDGLVTQEKGLILGVNSADCLPVLFYDPQKAVIGAAHTGWQGLFKKIPEKMVDLLVKLGSCPEDLLVGVGPYIRGCSYKVDQAFVKKFKNKFGLIKDMINHRKDGLYFDLGVLAKSQLINSGIKEKNLEFSQVCTVCQNQDFYSFRKDKKNYGEMLGIISLKK